MFYNMEGRSIYSWLIGFAFKKVHKHTFNGQLTFLASLNMNFISLATKVACTERTFLIVAVVAQNLKKQSVCARVCVCL